MSFLRGYAFAISVGAFFAALALTQAMLSIRARRNGTAPPSAMPLAVMMCVGIMAFEFVEFYFLHPGASDRLVMASIMFFVAWLVVIMLGCPFVIAYRRTMPVLTEDERERLFSRLLEGSESSANFFVGIHAVRLMYGAILIGGFLALVLVWAFKR